MLSPHRTAQTINVLMRLGSLAAKFLLALYMGRYLSLADVGTYGLVFGTVMILAAIVGFKLDYIVTREIVGTTPEEALYRTRDQAIFYLLTNLAIAVVMVVLDAAGVLGIDRHVLIYALPLSAGESIANILYANMTSMHQPLRANAVFFVRAGLWVFPVIILGVIAPQYRTADAVLIGWSLGVLASFAAVFKFWKHVPWGKLFARPIDWSWMRAGMRKSFFIWLGAFGVTLGVYIDRFVVMRYLGLDYVGVVTLYFSFVNALFALMQSGVFSFVYPRLVLMHRQGDAESFRAETLRMAKEVALFSGLAAVGMGVAISALGPAMQKPLLVSCLPTFWLMLLAIWVRMNAETLYNILFARHQDRAIWLGNLLFLIPSFGLNALLVPIMGMPGIGYGALAASAFLFVWRWVHIGGRSFLHSRA